MRNDDGPAGAGVEQLAVKVETENWQTHTRPSAGRLRELVCRIGGAGDRWLVVQRIPDLPDVFVQVWHEDGDDGPGEYRLEHREGPDRFFGTVVTDPERVAAAMTGWARRADGWADGFAWAAVDHGAPQDVPELPDEVQTRVEERVRTLLACGYGTRAQLAEAAEEYLVDGAERPVSRPQAQRLVDRLWVERVAEQETWEGITGPERVGRAFEALEARGITARENFTCCRSCGTSEIGAEREDARGFVFFHSQGTEGAAAGHGLVLLYGGFDGSADTTAAVGREVVAALGEAGLSTEWDGDPARSITVAPLVWRRRLVG